jgi:signal peptidase
MLLTTIRAVRRFFQLIWLTGIVLLLGGVFATQVLPALNHDVFIVEGGSMEPAIHLGSAVITDRVDVATLQVGDIVTFRGENGTVVTHRLVALPGSPGDALHTKGDANPTADVNPLLPENVIGRVRVVVPTAGVVLTALSSTSGAVLTLGMLGALLVSIWFLDELQKSVRRSASRRAALVEPAR